MNRLLAKVARPTRRAGFLADATASEVAEAALVLPLAFMMLLGIYWFGRAFNIYATINHAAREGARAAVAQTCATCGNGPNSQAATIVTQALQASSVDPGQIQLYPATPPSGSCGGAATACNNATNNITVCTNVQLTPTSSPYPEVCGVSVSFEYPYQFSLPFTSLNQQQFLLKADVQMKGEY
jgi:Flp pilus assembly protein TadG